MLPRPHAGAPGERVLQRIEREVWERFAESEAPVASRPNGPNQAPKPGSIFVDGRVTEIELKEFE